MNIAKTIIIAIVLAGFCGCSIYRAPVPLGDYYYINPDADFARIGKVALIQLKNNSTNQQISLDVTAALYEQIQKKQRFSLRVVPENDPDWRSLELEADSPIKPRQLLLAAKTLHCDAVMLGEITQYSPYPHMVLGLRLRMVDCSDGRLLWAFEQVWDAADKKTEYKIKKYLADQARCGTQGLGEQLVAVSSIEFVKFVGYEVAMTF
jgi:hypothetical protein